MKVTPAIILLILDNLDYLLIRINYLMLEEITTSFLRLAATSIVVCVDM